MPSTSERVAPRPAWARGLKPLRGLLEARISESRPVDARGRLPLLPSPRSVAPTTNSAKTVKSMCHAITRFIDLVSARSLDKQTSRISWLGIGFSVIAGYFEILSSVLQSVDIFYWLSVGYPNFKSLVFNLSAMSFAGEFSFGFDERINWFCSGDFRRLWLAWVILINKYIWIEIDSSAEMSSEMSGVKSADSILMIRLHGL